MRSPSAAPGEAEHALGDDVSKDLGGAGLDRVAAAAQLLVLPEAAVRVEELPLGAEQLEAELRQALVLLRPGELDPGALGPGHPRLDERRERAEVREAQALEVDPLAG